MVQCLNQREFLMINIKKNIIKIKESILNLELKLNREKNSVNLMAVSKMQNTTKIREAFNSGQKDFGEKRIGKKNFREKRIYRKVILATAITKNL